MATVTGQRRRRVPSWWVVLGIVAIVGVAWAVTSLAVGSGVSGGASVRVRPLLPGRLYRPAPTPADVERAFAAEGLKLAAAGSDLDAARFGPLRSHIVAAFELADPSAMLIVQFDRPESRAPTMVTDMAGDRDNGEAAGRVYVEYRASELDATTAAAVRRAFRRLQ